MQPPRRIQARDHDDSPVPPPGDDAGIAFPTNPVEPTTTESAPAEVTSIDNGVFSEHSLTDFEIPTFATAPISLSTTVTTTIQSSPMGTTTSLSAPDSIDPNSYAFSSVPTISPDLPPSSGPGPVRPTGSLVPGQGISIHPTGSFVPSQDLSAIPTASNFATPGVGGGPLKPSGGITDDIPMATNHPDYTPSSSVPLSKTLFNPQPTLTYSPDGMDRDAIIAGNYAHDIPLTDLTAQQFTILMLCVFLLVTMVAFVPLMGGLVWPFRMIFHVCRAVCINLPYALVGDTAESVDVDPDLHDYVLFKQKDGKKERIGRRYYSEMHGSFGVGVITMVCLFGCWTINGSKIASIIIMTCLSLMSMWAPFPLIRLYTLAMTFAIGGLWFFAHALPLRILMMYIGVTLFTEPFIRYIQDTIIERNAKAHKLSYDPYAGVGSDGLKTIALVCFLVFPIAGGIAGALFGGLICDQNWAEQFRDARVFLPT